MRSEGTGRAELASVPLSSSSLIPAASLLHSIILLPPPQTHSHPLHCPSNPPPLEVTGLPQRRFPFFSCTHSTRGLGRCVISPVFSLTWNIWHCDTKRKGLGICVCVCVCVYPEVHEKMWNVATEGRSDGSKGGRWCSVCYFWLCERFQAVLTFRTKLGEPEHAANSQALPVLFKVADRDTNNSDLGSN